jgi:cellulose synthase/poly-beta-1,6-N-acetylglucosamine synthase-like glycosyltransferase
MNAPFAPKADPLASARHVASARYTPRAVPWISPMIGGGVMAMFVALVAMAFARSDILAWSAGIAYILYDTALLAFTFWQTRKLLKRAPATPPTGPAPSLAIIVAAHNEERAIGVTIDALLAQTDAPEAILIADDGSTDGTGARLEALYGLKEPILGEASAPASAHPNLRWLRLPHGGKAGALNAALAHVSCDIVLTVDADTLLEPHAVVAMRAAFAQQPALVAATGVLTPVCGPSVRGRMFQWFQTYEYVRNFLSRFAWMQLNGLLLISGAFAAFRREALVTVGGFDSDCLVEDYELIHRLHRWSAEHGEGWQVAVIGAARARTDAPETLMTFLRQRRRWFAGFLQTQRWNRDMTGNPRFAKLGTVMMPVKAIDTFQPVYGLAAFALLIGFVATGRHALAVPIVLIMLAKVAIDLAFHLWSLALYRNWTGDRQSAGAGRAVMASILEPFSFQLLRHAGAVWGWWTFLTGQHSWGRQRRSGIAAQATPSLP